MQNSPDNTNLDALLNYWKDNKNEDSYKNIVEELLKGNTFLYIPVADKLNEKEILDISKLKDKTIRFTSVLNRDGLLVVVVFSDETSLKMWAKRDIGFIKLKTKDLLTFCDSKSINRIIINANQSNAFVLEKGKKADESNVSRNSSGDVKLWVPKRPIKGDLLNNIIMSCANVSTVSEVYHFGASRDVGLGINQEKHSLVLGVKLDLYSEDAKHATLIALDKAINNKKTELPIEIIFLDNEEFYKGAKSLKDSLIYKRV